MVKITVEWENNKVTVNMKLALICYLSLVTVAATTTENGGI